MLRAGDVAPDFTVPDQDGNQVTLSALRGQPVVLYFYPKDDTPGCTIQACSLRDHSGELKRRGAVVLGVSGDSVSSHRKFIAKYGLPFPLLADARHELGKAYGVWKFKTMFGKQVGFYERTTFVIDAEGRVKQVLPKVKPDQHVDLVLAAL
ncbi:MAG: thioredoxin-dependent thiol peroxidase [Gemmatimonadetes bacterium]|nr:thioredoxin-dependent thiol peroxidase [Gemmatimonadota bacterium]